MFQCNRKLIGGQPFLETYNDVVGGEVYPDSARDSNGHGTHTTTTAAGNIVDNVQVFGIQRGPISGVAPGAWVLAYKVCGVEGCFGSDSAAAVQQAILDGADVINFSISGGTNPFTDPVELAFLGAYQAGITVAASAGNEGPGAGTVNHLSPWVITVAASTQARAFNSTLTLTGGGDTVELVGSSITHGLATPAPVVQAKDLPGSTDTANACGTALRAGNGGRQDRRLRPRRRRVRPRPEGLQRLPGRRGRRSMPSPPRSGTRRRSTTTCRRSSSAASCTTGSTSSPTATWSSAAPMAARTSSSRRRPW